MAVKDWVRGFMDRHRARYAPNDWPTVGTEEYNEFLKGWVTAFALKQASECEADAASVRLATTPPNWRREHIPAVVGMIEAIRKEKGGEQPVGSTREAAEFASRNCQFCSGAGMTTVYHPAPDPARKESACVAAHCSCPAGRWMRSRLAEQSPELLRRIPDLLAVTQGYSTYQIDPPGFDPNAEPKPFPGTRALATSLAEKPE
jgi:hypothetical protein